MIGAVLGAVIVNGAKTLFTGWFPEIWLFALGALFVGVTLFMPKGVMGLLRGDGGGTGKVKLLLEKLGAARAGRMLR